MNSSHHPLLQTASEISALAERLSQETIIAFDTEFIRESTFYPIVELIQVATRDEAWLVDARPFKKAFQPGPKGGYDPGIEPLLDVFRNPKILKVLHAAQGDQECLYTSFAMVASPVVDTAVAASLLGYGDNIGLSRLMKGILDIDLPKGHARTNWSLRPLPEPMIKYALADVDRLVELGEKLLARVDQEGRRDWAIKMSGKLGDPAQFDVDPVRYAERLARGGHLDAKAAGALLELIEWRETRVRELNIPRRWLADDAVLIDLARTRPKTLEHLGNFRGLSKGEIRNSGQSLLDAIHRGESEPRMAPPERKKPIIPSESEALVIELVRCYLNILAREHKVAVRHLATAPQLLPLLREKLETPQDLVRHGILSAESVDLIGNQLLTFIHGEIGLRVRNRGVEIIKV